MEATNRGGKETIDQPMSSVVEDDIRNEKEVV